MLSLFVLSMALGACGSDARRETPSAPRRHAPAELPRLPSRLLGPVPLPAMEKAVVPTVADPVLGARVLVLSPDGTEPGLTSVLQVLEYQGTPYELWVVTDRPPLTAADLFNGTESFFQGVLLTVGSLGFFDGAQWTSALAPEQWQVLRDYEAAFKLRELTWYAYPTPEMGLEWPEVQDTSLAPLPVQLTAAGMALFPYLRSARAVTLSWAYTYLARPTDPAVTPLLVDDAQHALAWARPLPNGVESVTLAFDANANLLHALQLSPGLLAWLTRGLFVGAQRAFMSAQMDDMFIADDLWPSGEWRNTPADMDAVLAWETQQRRDSTTPNLLLTLAFNGEGADTHADPLTAAAARWGDRVAWVNHTWSHLNLDDADAATTTSELTQNNDLAHHLKLKRFNKANLVTPDVSGLHNAAALQAAADMGVRYLVSDTSRPGEDNPAPNVALRNTLEPRILMLPRRPTNLFYNVSKPAEWVGEYNVIHGAYWGRDLTYTEILDKESDVLLRYLLRGEMDPWMFHVANLRAYSPSRTLLTDLLQRTLTKYRASFKLPVQFLEMDDLGALFEQRTRAAESTLTARIRPGESITLQASADLKVPVTGITAGVTTVNLRAGTPVTLPLH